MFADTLDIVGGRLPGVRGGVLIDASSWYPRLMMSSAVPQQRRRRKRLLPLMKNLAITGGILQVAVFGMLSVDGVGCAASSKRSRGDRSAGSGGRLHARRQRGSHAVMKRAFSRRRRPLSLFSDRCHRPSALTADGLTRIGPMRIGDAGRRPRSRRMAHHTLRHDRRCQHPDGCCC
jgi:hypothetical protein